MEVDSFFEYTGSNKVKKYKKPSARTIVKASAYFEEPDYGEYYDVLPKEAPKGKLEMNPEGRGVLLDIGFTEADINAYLSGDKKLEDIIQSILYGKDDSRRRMLYEFMYLKSCGMECNRFYEIPDLLAPLVNLVTKEDIVGYLITQGGSLEDLLNLPIDIARLAFNESLFNGKEGNLKFGDVFLDLKYLEELKKCLTEVNGKHYWTGTEDQYKFYSNVRNEDKGSIIEKIDWINECVALLKDEIDLRIEFVDKYKFKDDFKEKCTPNYDLLLEAPFVGVLGTEELAFFLGCKMNGLLECQVGVTRGQELNVYYKGKSLPTTYSMDSKWNKYFSWLDYIDDDHKNVYNYIYNTEGAESALKYLEDISRSLDRTWCAEEEKKDRQFAEENPWTASFLYMLRGFGIPENLMAMGNSLWAKICGNELYLIDVYSSSRVQMDALSDEHMFVYAVTQAVRIFAIAGTMGVLGKVEGLSNFAQFVFNIAISNIFLTSDTYVDVLTNALKNGYDVKEASGMAFSCTVMQTVIAAYMNSRPFSTVSPSEFLGPLKSAANPFLGEGFAKFSFGQKLGTLIKNFFPIAQNFVAEHGFYETHLVGLEFIKGIVETNKIPMQLLGSKVSDVFKSVLYATHLGIESDSSVLIGHLENIFSNKLENGEMNDLIAYIGSLIALNYDDSEIIRLCLEKFRKLFEDSILEAYIKAEIG